MEVLNPRVDAEAFFAHLRTAPSRVLLLDYDGTLAPFRVERDQAVPYPEARSAVEGLLADGASRIVVISGRAVEALRPLLGVEPPPELWGTHGWERLRPGAGLERVDPGEAARTALADAREAAEGIEGAAGRVEVKPATVAVHVRGLSDREADGLLDEARRRWEGPARRGGLEVHAFDGGLELRVPGRSKADAVREALADEPRGTAVAYLGDDLTDEDAFEALGALDREGRIEALRVLVRPERRDTAADVWVKPPEGLMAFLERWERATDAG